jgi:hypothetical protein
MRQKNLHFLKKFNNNLYARIVNLKEKNFTLIPGKKEAHTLIYHSNQGDYYLHSRFAPLQEAKRMLEIIDFEADHIIVLGLGLGYHLNLILQRKKPAARVLIVEQSFEILSHSLSVLNWEEIFSRKDLFFYFGQDLNQLPQTISTFIDIISFKKLEYFELPSQKQFSTPYFSQSRSIIDNEIKTILYDFKTRLAEKNTVGANILENVRHIYNTKPGYLLKDKFAGKPGFIVSAGPSLDKNILQLKKIRNRGVILTVDTALKPLLKRKINPHFVLVADPSFKNFAHLAGIGDSYSNWLVTDAGVSGEVYREFQSRIYSVSLQRPLMNIIQKNVEPIGNIDAWGSVISLALNFAIYCGLNPIIFLGLDFAYSANRNHCRGSSWEEQWLENYSDLEKMQRREKESIRGIARSIKTTDIYGRDTITSERFLLYKNYFINELKKAKTSRVFINATEGGIVTELENQNLSGVIQKYIFGQKQINFDQLCNETFKFTNRTREKLIRFLKSKRDFFHKYKLRIIKLTGEIEKSDHTDSSIQHQLLEKSEKTMNLLYAQEENGQIVEQWSQAPIFYFLRDKKQLVQTPDQSVDHTKASKIYLKYFNNLLPVLEELETNFQRSYLNQ